jgi:hypothetical protein
MINNEGYFCKRNNDVFLIKAFSNNKKLYGYFRVGMIYFKKKMIGKRIKLKIEVIK